jgi:hypothetical protein
VVKVILYLYYRCYLIIVTKRSRELDVFNKIKPNKYTKRFVHSLSVSGLDARLFMIVWCLLFQLKKSTRKNNERSFHQFQTNSRWRVFYSDCWNRANSDLWRDSSRSVLDTTKFLMQIITRLPLELNEHSRYRLIPRFAFQHIFFAFEILQPILKPFQLFSPRFQGP